MPKDQSSVVRYDTTNRPINSKKSSLPLRTGRARMGIIDRIAGRSVTA